MRKFFFCLILVASTFLHVVSRAQQLTATIIGSGAPAYNEHRANASVLISQGHTQILVDMGNGTQINLHKLGVDTRSLSALLFTHHHIDHNQEFIPLLIRSLLGRHEFKIIGPPNTVKLTETNLKLYTEDINYRMRRSNRKLSDRSNAFDARDIKGGESFKIDNINISTIKVPHSIHALAYRFDHNGRSIVVTGDMAYTDNLQALAKNADYMIIESGGMIMKNGRSRRRMRGARQGQGQQNWRAGRQSQGRPGGQRAQDRAHVNLHESSLMAKQANVKNLVYTHFGVGELDEEASLREIVKNYSGNVIFSKDLLVLNDKDK